MNLDPTVVRIASVVLFFITTGFPVILGYIIATMVIPNEEDVGRG